MRRVGLSGALVLRSDMIRCSSVFQNVSLGPPDPILGLGVAFNADQCPTKVNLGVGVYRDDSNKPYVLECVKKVPVNVADFEYAPISGIASFVKNAQKLAFANSTPLERVASSQSLSGTGALRVAGDFLNRFHSSKKILVPNPTWGNHLNIFRDAGLAVDKYTYYSAATQKINLDGLIKDLSDAPEASIVLLHACAHNPTGLDPTQAEWKQILEVVLKKKHLPLVDMAYQGFASGNLETDAFAVRLFAEHAPNMVMCQSFAKSFGLYGHRVGAVHFVTKDAEECERVLSQLKILIRPMYSNPPIQGARYVDAILSNPDLKAEWVKDLAGMAARMNAIRVRLVDELKKEGSNKDWSHILKQIGMMAFTGLSKDQVAILKSEHHVYMTDDGRAAISGLNNGNVQYVAKAFHDVTK